MKTNCVHCKITEDFDGHKTTRICEIDNKCCYYDSIWSAHEENCFTYSPKEDQAQFRINAINEKIAVFENAIKVLTEERKKLE